MPCNEKLKMGWTDAGPRTTNALLLLSGYCGDNGMYRELAQQLKERHRVVLADLPGQYSSPRPKSDFTAADIASAIVELANELKLQRFVLGSYAHANWITLEVRKRLGDRVAGLIWFDWLLTRPTDAFFVGLQKQQLKEEWIETRERYFDSWSDYNPDFRHLFTRYMGEDNYDCWRRGGYEIAEVWRNEGSPFELLAKMDPMPPTLHVYTEHQGKYFYGDAQRYLQAQLDFEKDHPAFRVAALKETRSHMPQAEAPKLVASVLQPFLSETGV